MLGRPLRSILDQVATGSLFIAAILLLLSMANLYGQDSSLPNNDLSRQFRITDRLAQLNYRRGLADLDAGQTRKGLNQFLEILGKQADSEVLPAQGGRFESVRQLIYQRMDRLSADEIVTLERMVGTTASKMLDTAIVENDLSGVQLVSRQYFHTKAGFDATNWLSMRWIDQGRYAIAARNWQRLIGSAVHGRSVDQKILIKTCSALALAGQVQEATDLSQQLPERIRIGGRPKIVSTWLSELSSANLQDRGSNDWRMPVGNLERNRKSNGSPPYLKQQWTRSLLEKNLSPRGFAIEVNDWIGRRVSDRLLTVSVACYPIVLGDTVIARTPNGIVAFELDSGKTLWAYQSEVDSGKLVTKVQSVLRDYNRTLERTFVGNSASGMLTSNGQLVFALDVTLSKQPLNFGAITPSDLQALGIKNRLVALDAVNGKTPVWSLGGGNSPLANHSFLGPPVPVDTQLYVLSQHDKEIYLSTLIAATGKVVSTQAISLVESPIGGRTETYRKPSAMIPSVSNGIILCPSSAGTLVATDSLTGSLLWTYYFRDDPPEQIRRRFFQSRSHGHVGYANFPVVANGCVYYLPRYSDFIHCLKLSTGEFLWKRSRNGGEYIATVDSKHLVLVGASYTRGLSVEDGSVSWEKLLGTPAGRGIALNGTYLLPLKSGRVVNLDVSSGNADGLTLASQATADDEPRILTLSEPDNRTSAMLLGNLIAANGRIVSMNATSVKSFSQSAELLDRLTLIEAPSINDQLLLAELAMVLGKVDVAESRLEKLAADAVPESRDRARGLLRELLYYRLENEDTDPKTLYSRIDKLATSPWQRARSVLERAEWQYGQRNIKGLLASVGELEDLRLDLGFPKTGDPHLHATIASWIPRLLEGVRREFTNEEIATIAESADAEWKELKDTEDIEALEAFVVGYRSWPQSGPARNRLAKLLIEENKFQAAEFLLLESRKHPHLTVQGEATVTLFELWKRLGLNREAGRLLQELNTKFYESSVGKHETGKSFMANVSRKTLAWQNFTALQPLSWDVELVNIRENQLSDRGEYLRRDFQGRRRMRGTDEASFHVFERGSQRDQLMLADQESGVKLGEIRIPSNPWYPRAFHVRGAGHFAPIGTSAAVCGVSLLEHRDARPMWTHFFESARSSNSAAARPGPCGPSFCTFQTRQGLVVIDPVSGRLLWKRDDIPNDGGLFKDQYTGLFGDERVLVLFHSDNKTYTMFETLSGRKLREGTLDRDMGYTRHVFGRRLCFIGLQGISRKIRIWDPIRDHFDLDMPLVGRYLSDVTPEGELALVVNGNRLVIIDVAGDMKTNLAMKLTAVQVSGLNYLRVFSDPNNYYINLQRAESTRRSNVYYTHISDTYLPSSNIDGPLFAVKRKSGFPRWAKLLPKRTVLRNPTANLPFLVMMSQVRELQSNSFRSNRSLMVEVLDARTGNVIGTRSQLLNDQIVHQSLDREAGLMQLFGFKNRIDIRFGRKLQRVGREIDSL